MGQVAWHIFALWYTVPISWPSYNIFVICLDAMKSVDVSEIIVADFNFSQKAVLVYICTFYLSCSMSKYCLDEVSHNRFLLPSSCTLLHPADPGASASREDSARRHCLTSAALFDRTCFLSCLSFAEAPLVRTCSGHPFESLGFQCGGLRRTVILFP